MTVAGGLHYVVLFSAYAVAAVLSKNVRRAAQEGWGNKPITRF